MSSTISGYQARDQTVKIHFSAPLEVAPHLRLLIVPCSNHQNIIHLFMMPAPLLDRAVQ